MSVARTTTGRTKVRPRIAPSLPISADGRPDREKAARDSMIACVEALIAGFESMASRLQSLEAELQSQSTPRR